jgi:hypothetical protein
LDRIDELACAARLQMVIDTLAARGGFLDKMCVSDADAHQLG